ncbi:hypothetical protein KM043_016856 [Ampulex compressa]|nr:hypothetical protein KM043_016856 [Ampulex compressa]
MATLAGPMFRRNLDRVKCACSRIDKMEANDAPKGSACQCNHEAHNSPACLGHPSRPFGKPWGKGAREGPPRYINATLQGCTQQKWDENPSKSNQLSHVHAARPLAPSPVLLHPLLDPIGSLESFSENGRTFSGIGQGTLWPIRMAVLSRGFSTS